MKFAEDSLLVVPQFVLVANDKLLCVINNVHEFPLRKANVPLAQRTLRVFGLLLVENVDAFLRKQDVGDVQAAGDFLRAFFAVDFRGVVDVVDVDVFRRLYVEAGFSTHFRLFRLFRAALQEKIVFPWAVLYVVLREDRGGTGIVENVHRQHSEDPDLNNVVREVVLKLFLLAAHLVELYANVKLLACVEAVKHSTRDVVEPVQGNVFEVRVVRLRPIDDLGAELHRYLVVHHLQLQDRMVFDFVGNPRHVVQLLRYLLHRTHDFDIIHWL